MKKFVLFLLTAYSLCSAQTTITKTFNDPVVGDVVNNYAVNGTVDNSETGSGVTFSNPTLTQGAASVTNYVTPTSSEITTFQGSNIKMIGTGSTIFYKSSATKLEITGIITPDATLNFSADNGTFITYPASYGHTETDNARGTFTSPIASGLFKGTITTTADASGTLIVGSKTYINVLRIKSVQNFNLYQSTDTSYLFPIGTVTNTAYTYYDNTHKFSLLSSTNGNISIPILSINQSVSDAQALNEVFLSVENSIKRESFKIYPNPAQDFIEFKGKTEDYSNVNIYTLEGKLIKASDINSEKIQISNLPPATYFIEVIRKDTKKETAKFIKK